MGGGGYMGPMDHIKPVVNYRFELLEGPLTKGQFSQLAIGIDTSSFQFWKLNTPLILYRLENVVPPVSCFLGSRSAALEAPCQNREILNSL